jgi:hypothetical protein
VTRSSGGVPWPPVELASERIRALLHSFGSAQGASKASPLHNLDVERQRLLLKFVDTFNCGERQRKLVHDSGG